MRKIIGPSLGLFLLEAVFQLARSNKFSIVHQNLPHTLNMSNFTGSELSSFIKSLNRGIALNIIILHDQNYKGIASRMTSDLQEISSGIVVFEYSIMSADTMKTLLKPFMGKTLFLVLCQPDASVGIFEMIRVKRLESHLATWILILEETKSRNIFVDSLEKFIFEGTQVLIFTKETTGRLVVTPTMTDASGIVRFGISRRLGDLSLNEINDLVSPNYKVIYSDMKGREVLATSLDSPPLVIKGKFHPDVSAEDVDTGIEILIAEAWAKTLNFSFRTVEPEDGNYGYPQPDGSVNGMVGLVARREAFFALGGIAVNDKRLTVIDYVYLYNGGPLCLYSRSPKLKNTALAALSPFSYEMWIILIITTLSMGPIINFESRISQFIKGDESKDSLQGHSFNTFRNIVNQGNQLLVQNWSQKFIFYSWYLFCLIASALYSGNLTAVLAVPAYEEPIDSLEDLPEAIENGFTLGVVRESTNEYLFKEAKDGIYKKTWELFNHEDRSQSFLEEFPMGVKKVMTEKFVFVAPDIKFIILAETFGRRKFHYGRECFFHQYAGFPVASGAPYRENLDKVTLGLNSGGLYGKWKADAVFNMTKGSTQLADDTSETNSFSLTQLQAAFFLVAIGYFLGTFILLMEFLVSGQISNIF